MSEEKVLEHAFARGEKSVRAARKPCRRGFGERSKGGAHHRRHGISSLIHNRLNCRWPGCAVGSMDRRVSISLFVLSQSRHLEHDERNACHSGAGKGSTRKYRHGLKVMGGGFTLSGGEPLMQDRFAVRLFSAAKAMGIHTALDTNGFLGERLTRRRIEPSRPGASGYQVVGP